MYGAGNIGYQGNFLLNFQLEQFAFPFVLFIPSTDFHTFFFEDASSENLVVQNIFSDKYNMGDANDCILLV